jgi:hypothetical protein
MFSVKSPLNMSLSSVINYKPNYRPPLVQTTINKINPTLNASMIGRIHNARPGCGSCGK